MSEVKIETYIELDDYQLDERIVQSAGEQLIERASLSPVDATKALHAALAKHADERVTKILSAGIQPVDTFGQPKGDKVPVDEILTDAIKNWLNHKVNSRDGSPLKDRYGGITRGEFLLRKLAVEGIERMARKEVLSVREQAKKEIRDTIAKAVAEQLAKGTA